MTLSVAMTKVMSSFYEACDTPRALTCHLLAKYGEWGQLLALQPPAMPVLYCGPSPKEYHMSLSATDLLRKCDGLPTGVDLELAAVRAAYEAERSCALTEVRVRRVLIDGGPLEPSDIGVADFFDKVRRRIARVLGKAPHVFDLRIGSGASVSDPSSRTTVADKISNPRTSMTASFPRDCYLDWMQTAWYDCRVALDSPSRPFEPDKVRGNVFFTVPKDSVKRRGAAKEPVLNGAYQLSVGRYIRQRLLSVGLCLRTGKELHMRLAREASVSQKLATIDLSSASDTICSALVEALVPSDWYGLLAGLRSAYTFIPSLSDRGMGRRGWLHLRKFSSMGNGFTFELETLIFWAIAFEACRAQGLMPETGVDLAVFGDDIIVPTNGAVGVLAALRWAGFEPNSKKTFITGWFRESCGGDYLGGVSVRSHFIKELPREPQHWISLANGIRRLATQNGGLFDLNSRFWRPWLRCLDALPSDIRGLRGPVHLGDVVIHDDAWESCIRTGLFKRDDQCRYVRGYTPVQRVVAWNNWPDVVRRASMLYLIQNRARFEAGWRHVGPYRDDDDWYLKAIDDTDYDAGLVPRCDVLGYRITKISAG